MLVTRLFSISKWYCSEVRFDNSLIIHCEVRGPKPQLLVFIYFTLISHSELKINLDVHPSWILSLLSGLIDIVVSTSLFR